MTIPMRKRKGESLMGVERYVTELTDVLKMEVRSFNAVIELLILEEKSLVAFDTARAGEGDLVFFESGKEAAQANPNGWFNPGDAAIIGVVDAVNTEGGA